MNGDLAIVQNSPNSVSEQNSLRSPVYLLFGGITYPLIGRYTSKTQGGFYLLSTDVEGAFYGLTLFNATESVVQTFEDILSRFSTFNANLPLAKDAQQVVSPSATASQANDTEWNLASPISIDGTPSAADSGAATVSSKSNVSSSILTVAEVTKKGIMGVAKVVSGTVSYAFLGLGALIGKREKDIEVSPETLQKLESIRKTSATAAQYVTAALEFLFGLTYDFGKLTLNALMNTSAGKAIGSTAESTLGDNVKEIAGTSVVAVATVWLAMSEATSVVVNGALKDAGNFVENSFGKELGKATKLTFGVASDANEIRHAVQSGLKKRVIATKLAVKASKDLTQQSTTATTPATLQES